MACPWWRRDAGGPEELVDDSTGRLAQVGEASSLAAAIEEVLLRYDAFDPAELRRRAETFDYRQIAARTLELYETCLQSAQQTLARIARSDRRRVPAASLPGYPSESGPVPRGAVVA